MDKKIYFVKGSGIHFEIYHPIVELDGIRMRGRSELLVVKGDKVYLSKEKHGLCCENLNSRFEYNVAGGGWNKDEPHDITALRESMEETRIIASNIKYAGDYCVVYPEPKPWVKEKVDPEYQWRGYYTEVYIGTYSNRYTGEIKDGDKDDIIYTGHFYPIDEVISLINPVHQKAIKEYMNLA